MGTIKASKTGHLNNSDISHFIGVITGAGIRPILLFLCQAVSPTLAL